MGKRDFGAIIQIGDVLVSEDVVTEYFACDYQKCKGCCCIYGDSGAPLDESELEPLERNYHIYSPLMQVQGREVIDKIGFFDIDRDGDLVTPVIPGEPGKEACAYTHFDEDGNCLCSIERCFFNGTCRFRKPDSCWLYPIRVTRMPGGSVALNLHRWSICKDAFQKGKEENIRVYEFLREPLTQIYGEEFYEALSAAAKQLFGA